MKAPDLELVKDVPVKGPESANSCPDGYKVTIVISILISKFEKIMLSFNSNFAPIS